MSSLEAKQEQDTPRTDGFADPYDSGTTPVYARVSSPAQGKVARPNSRAAATKSLLEYTAEAFAVDGVLTEMGFTHYSQQAAYANLIAETLAKGKDPERGTRIRFLEGETGTGKTLGYLVPLLTHAVLSGERTGVSVQTLDLQTQIWGAAALAEGRVPDYGKDSNRSELAVALEVVRRMLGTTPSVAIRRGMTNYVSVQKAREAIRTLRDNPASRDGSLDADCDPEVLDGFECWVEAVAAKTEGTSGLLAHAPELPGGIQLQDVQIDSAEIPEAEHGNPFYVDVLGDSKSADFLVHTHALAVVNAMHWHAHLDGKERALTAIVFDEADKIEAAAALMAHKHVRPRQIKSRLEKLGKALEEMGATQTTQTPQLAVAITVVNQAIAAADEAIGWLIETDPEPEGRKKEAVLLLDDKKNETLRMEAVDMCLLLAKHCRAVVKSCDELDPFEEFVDLFRDWAEQLVKIAGVCKDPGAHEVIPAAEISDVVKLSGREDAAVISAEIPALSWSPSKRWASFGLMDLYPARRLGAHWAQRKDGTLTAHSNSIIFTSATLRSFGKNPWTDVQINFGVHESRNALMSHESIAARADFGQIDHYYLASPYSPKPVITVNAAQAAGDTDTESDPREPLDTDYVPNPEWALLVAEVIASLLDHASPGEANPRALCLTPAYRDVVLIRDTMQARFGAEYTKWVYWHEGVTAPRGGKGLQEGIAQLQDGAVRILLSPSPWQGHDIRCKNKSQLFEHLVLCRLPFSQPDLARDKALRRFLRALGKDPDKVEHLLFGVRFRKMYNQTRQGLGRLIRKASDRGSIWVLDPRFPMPADGITNDPRLQGQGNKTITDMRSRYAFLNGAIPERFMPAATDRLRVVEHTIIPQGEHEQGDDAEAVVSRLNVHEPRKPRFIMN